MKWDKTQQWIDNSQELLMIALSYCGCLSYADGTPLQKVSVGQPLDIMADRQKAYDILSSMNPKLVVDELESVMSCDTRHDVKVFEVWSAKLMKGTDLLSLFDTFFESKQKAPDSWLKIGGWEQYIMQTRNKYEFVWLIAVVLQQKFDSLSDGVNFLVESYGLEETNSAEVSTSVNNGKIQEPKLCKPVPNIEKSIYNIIQCEDKEGFVKRLHCLIDGKHGKAVAVVFYRAMTDGYITKPPTQAMYESEFGIIGKNKWEAIRKHFDKGDSADMIADSSNIRFN